MGWVVDNIFTSLQRYFFLLNFFFQPIQTNRRACWKRIAIDSVLVRRSLVFCVCMFYAAHSKGKVFYLRRMH